MVQHERVVAGPPEEDVAQEVTAVLVLHRRDRALLGDQQRHHRGGPLECLDVVGSEPTLGAHADQPDQVGPGGSHLDQADLPLLERQPLRAVGAAQPLDPEPAAGVEQLRVGQPRAHGVVQRGTALPPVRRGHDDADPDDAGDLGGDLVEAGALEDQLRQRRVQPVDAPQGRRARLDGSSREVLIGDLHA